MQLYDQINQASVAAFEAALSNKKPSSSLCNAADTFAAALNGQSRHDQQLESQQRLDKHFEKEYCGKGNWHNGWRSARAGANPPECRITWEADMRQMLLSDALMQTAPL